MKIVVTGASGFIGKKLIKYCSTIEDLEITALYLEGESVDDIYQNCKWVSSDYSCDDLAGAFKGADTVVHLAAVRGTDDSMIKFQINEILTESVLKAMAVSGVKRIVFASSIAVFSDISLIPWNEETPLSPKTLYGVTKASCEYIIKYYCRKYSLRYSILRISQVIGLEETNKGMMNAFISKAYNKETLTVIGKSVAERQYIYVDDLIKALYISVFPDDMKSYIFNIGMDRAYSNLCIAETINRVFNNVTEIEYRSKERETIEASFMDNTLMKEILKLQPRDLEKVMQDILTRMCKEIV